MDFSTDKSNLPERPLFAILMGSTVVKRAEVPGRISHGGSVIGAVVGCGYLPKNPTMQTVFDLC